MTVTEIHETIEGPDEAEILAFPTATPEEDEAVKYHSILEVWATILDGAAEYAKNNRISPQWANEMVQSYSQITFAGTSDLHKLYYERTQRLHAILLDIIGKHDGCFKVFDTTEDREQNSEIYKEVLTEWQLEITRWELAWDPKSKDAAIEVACFGQMHKAFFGQTGLTQYLDNIQLGFTEADAEALQAELAALKAGDRE